MTNKNVLIRHYGTLYLGSLKCDGTDSTHGRRFPRNHDKWIRRLSDAIDLSKC